MNRKIVNTGQVEKPILYTNVSKLYKNLDRNAKLFFEPLLFKLLSLIPMRDSSLNFMKNITELLSTLNKISNSDTSYSSKIRSIFKEFALALVKYGFTVKYYIQKIDTSLSYEEVALPAFNAIEKKYYLESNSIHQFLLSNNFIINKNNLFYLPEKTTISSILSTITPNSLLYKVRTDIENALLLALPFFNSPVNTFGMYSTIDNSVIFKSEFPSSFNQRDPLTGLNILVYLAIGEAFTELLLDPNLIYLKVEGTKNRLHKPTGTTKAPDFFALAIQGKFNNFFITITPDVTSIMTRSLFKHPFIIGNLGESLSFIINNIDYQAKIREDALLLAQSNTQLERQSNRDGLTGLLNRRGIFSRYSQALVPELIRKEGNINSQISIAMMDIDKFKRVNEVFDHIMGDAILKFLSGQMTRFFRVTDMVGRYGGEEFLCIIPLDSASATDTKTDRLDEFRDFFSKQVYSQEIPLYEKNPDILSLLKICTNLLFYELDENKTPLYAITPEFLNDKLTEYKILFQSDDPSFNDFLQEIIHTIIEIANISIGQKKLELPKIISMVASVLDNLDTPKRNITLNLCITLSIGVSTLANTYTRDISRTNIKSLKHSLSQVIDAEFLNTLYENELIYLKTLTNAFTVADSNLKEAKTRGRNTVVRN